MGWSRSRGVRILLPAAALGVLLGQTSISVGDGAPDSITLSNFILAFNRGTFSTAVTLPPRDRVHRVGPGYVQNFTAANLSAGFSYLLAQADTNPTMARPDVLPDPGRPHHCRKLHRQNRLPTRRPD